jgi:hypothetical protein
MKEITLPKLKTLDDFTQKEIAVFDEMLKVLADYNASIGTDHELPLPPYTDKEMAEFSGYRELVIAKESNLNPGKEGKVDFVINKFDTTDWVWE